MTFLRDWVVFVDYIFNSFAAVVVKIIESRDEIVRPALLPMIVWFCLVLYSLDAYCQDKFFSFPSRPGVEGAKQNAQLTTINNEFSRMNACTVQGHIYAPTNPGSDSNGCIHRAAIEATNGNFSVFGSGTFGNGLVVNNAAAVLNSGLSVSGNSVFNGPILQGANVIRDAGGGWVRTYGNSGWFSQTHGGGWYMVDSTWIRSYNNKGVYVERDGGSGSIYGINSGAHYGVYGQSAGNYGVYGRTTSASHGGVLGYSANGAIYGILGHANHWSIYGNGHGHFSGNVHAAAFLHTSDERLKTEIRTIETPLAQLRQIRGVRYNWKSDGRTAIGVIAQEVEKVLPEAIHTNTDGVKSVDSAQLVGLLIQAVQELQGRINELEMALPGAGEGR